MAIRAWSGVWTSVFALCCGVAAAQDPSREQELDALKKRVEALEKEKKQEPSSQEAKGADPVQDKWYDRVKLSPWARVSFRSIEDQALPSASGGKGTHEGYSRDFNLDSTQINMSGKITDNVTAAVDLDFSGSSTNTEELRILDAIGQFKIADELNIWVGRFLPPSDRVNIQGPYFQVGWDYPGTASALYPNITRGRDDGVAFWGDFEGGKYKYSIGLFEGAPNVDNGVDNLLVAARGMVCLLDPEPGYYYDGCYYGSKSVLTLGVAAMMQGDTQGVVGNKEDFKGFNIDVLFDKKLEFLGNGTVTVEGAFYVWDTGDFNGTGDSFLLSLAYLFPGKIGWGQLQPLVRIQSFDEDSDILTNAVETDVTRMDVGVNYIISGAAAKISLIYSSTDTENEPAAGGVGNSDLQHMFTLGVQVQL